MAPDFNKEIDSAILFEQHAQGMEVRLVVANKTWPPRLVCLKRKKEETKKKEGKRKERKQMTTRISWV